jgi:ribosome maturation factor RimP
LDREKEDFELNVSSAGMDKPLRHEKQFIKHTGKKISLLKKTGEVVEGVLIAYNDQCWIVDCEKKIKLPKKKAEVITERIEYLKTEIKEIKRVISFK